MNHHFSHIFHHPPTLSSSAPGRINLIGEHTDYNDGFVMPGAIDKKITFHLASTSATDLCKVYSVDMEETMEFSLKRLHPMEGGGWKNYIIGVVAELQNAGASLGAFEAIFYGNVPLGAGVSSSAALECALATGLNELFSLRFSQTQLAKIAQMAEHHYAGVACGIMDQFASVMGKQGHVFRLDCRSLEYEYFPLELGDYELVLLDTCVEHSLAGTEYNDRRTQCEEGVELLKKHVPEIHNLRDVSLTRLTLFQDEMPALIYQRCLHVVQENVRVLQACDAMKVRDMQKLGGLLYQSHDSLSQLYEVSCQELDFLVDFTRNKEEVLGARMMGGGFGGCTLNLIKSSEKEAFISAVSAAYFQQTGINLKAYAVALGDGAQAKFL